MFSVSEEYLKVLDTMNLVDLSKELKSAVKIREKCEKRCQDFLSNHLALKDKVIIVVSVESPLYDLISFDFSCETADEDEYGDSEVYHHRQLVSLELLKQVEGLDSLIESICRKSIYEMLFHVK